MTLRKAARIPIPRANRALTAAWDAVQDARDAVDERGKDLFGLTNKREVRGNSSMMGEIHDEQDFLEVLGGLLDVIDGYAHQAAPTLVNRLLMLPDYCEEERRA